MASVVAVRKASKTKSSCEEKGSEKGFGARKVLYCTVVGSAECWQRE